MVISLQNQYGLAVLQANTDTNIQDIQKNLLDDLKKYREMPIDELIKNKSNINKSKEKAEQISFLTQLLDDSDPVNIIQKGLITGFDELEKDIDILGNQELEDKKYDITEKIVNARIKKLYKLMKENEKKARIDMLYSTIAS